MTKNNMEKKAFIGIIYNPLRKEKAETQSSLKPKEKMLMPRPWKRAAYWLAAHGSLSLISNKTQHNI